MSEAGLKQGSIQQTSQTFSVLSLYQNVVLKLSNIRQYFSTQICVTGLLRVNYKNKRGLDCFHLHNTCNILVF